MGSDFHLMERPLVVIVQSHGEPIAIVPNLELESFEKTKFTGLVFDWRDQVANDANLQRALGHEVIALVDEQLRVRLAPGHGVALRS